VTQAPPEAQPVLTPLTSSAIFLILTIDEGGEAGVHDVLSDVCGLQRYASDPGVIEQMLSNMFLGDPPGNQDRILDFSTAHTGNLFFVPTADFLDDLPAPPAASISAAEPTEEGVADPAVAASDTDASLGIGSLRS
jgi:hypothetical protein